MVDRSPGFPQENSFLFLFIGFWVLLNLVNCMKVILVRHGEAEEASVSGSDQNRALTAKGQSDVRKVGRFIRGSQLNVTHVFHSPYLRTRVTASILSEEIQFLGQAISSEELSAGSSCDTIITCLQNLTNSDTVVLVGHNPDITFFAAQLLGNHSYSENLIFQPGSSVAINVAREKLARGQLLWAISPDLIDL